MNMRFRSLLQLASLLVLILAAATTSFAQSVIPNVNLTDYFNERVQSSFNGTPFTAV